MDAQRTITDEALAGAIASAFEDCFASFGTVLVGGAEEPLYRPSQGGEPAKLVFREDFPASALHEIATGVSPAHGVGSKKTLATSTFAARAVQNSRTPFFLQS